MVLLFLYAFSWFLCPNNLLDIKFDFRVYLQTSFSSSIIFSTYNLIFRLSLRFKGFEKFYVQKPFLNTEHLTTIIT